MPLCGGDYWFMPVALQCFFDVLGLEKFRASPVQCPLSVYIEPEERVTK